MKICNTFFKSKVILLAFRVTNGHLERLRRVIVLVNLRYLPEFGLTIKDSGKGHFPQCLRMAASGPISVASWENISGGPRFHESSRLSVFSFTENWLPSWMLFMICLNIWKKTFGNTSLWLPLYCRIAGVSSSGF